MVEVDWVKRWGDLVEARESSHAAGHSHAGYWDRRASSYARSTQSRVDDFLRILEPYLLPHKTLIDVGAGTGRHAVPLAERLEWVTAIEPSEGMRSHIAPRDNITVVASSWEDSEVAPADLVMCSHVLYGIADPVPFISKLEASARERVFVMMRESDLPHPATEVSKRLQLETGSRLPRFSELFMLLLQMGIAPDVQFISYPITTRYADFEGAVTDVRAMLGESWDDAGGRAALHEILRRDGDALVYDGGVALSGVAHWQPRKT
ncbi:MAG TPA: class I SAM-dependent methyltransferase [Candidatus Dormibacteraeota bacterium]|nr:class I SAM-dependent methyltransferase [Candidatus Dormibacteraeota bacterium]